MPGAADDKKQGGNGNDPDEASKLKQAAADLTTAAKNAARGIDTVTENTELITITNIFKQISQKRPTPNLQRIRQTHREQRNHVSMLLSQTLWIFVLRKCRKRLGRKTMLRRTNSRKLRKRGCCEKALGAALGNGSHD